MNAIPTIRRGALRGTTLVLLSVLAASLAFAAPAPQVKYFNDATTPNIIALLPMPPDAGTQEEIADRESSAAVFAARTPEQIARAKTQNKLSVFDYSLAPGTPLEKAKLPKTDALFARLDGEIIPLIAGAKKYYQRPRPVQIDSKRFADAIAKEPTEAYPGGHAARGTLYALLLAELYPAHRDALMEQGLETGWLRVQGGMVTPLDVYAGRVLGRALALSLLSNPEFLVDFEEARAEITALAKK